MTFVFLMTDVVGSTGLWERFGTEMPDVLARHDRIVHGAVTAAGGTVFKHTGDGMIAVFDDPDAAARSATAARADLAAADWSPLDDLRIRCSIHAGPATERDGDYFGPSLNRVARINGVTHPDQILASDAVHQLMGQPAGIDLGEHQLRDLGHPVRLWQLDDGEHPPLASLQKGLHNLPTQLTEFIGRQSEITQLTELLDQHRLVTLTGVGGCGKTRLALEMAATVSDRFSGGVWFVDLRAAEDHDQIVQQIAASIGLLAGAGAGTGDDLSDLIAEYAGREPTLIILDNCEHVVDDAADVAEDLLQRAATLTVVSTSREALAVEGERVWRIPSLAAASGEARELFIARALAADADFELRPDDRDLIDEICARLDGIPLAIELGAARVAHLSLADLNARLDERFSLLSGGRRARRQRQQTLQAMMDWSWELLDTDEQQMLPELAVFRGGFDPQGVDAVCSPPSRGDRFDVLTSLVDRSLVTVTVDEGASSRYQLLETVRLYGLDRLTARGDTTVVRDRHAEWVRGFNSSRRSAKFDVAEITYASRNADNMLAALDWFATKDDPVSVAEVAAGRFTSFAAERNIEGVRWLRRELLEAPELPYDIRLAAYFAAGQVMLLAGDYERWSQLSREGSSLIDTERQDRSPDVRAWEAQLCLSSAMTELNSGAGPGLYDRAVELWPEGKADYPMFDVVAGTLALVRGDPLEALEVTPVEPFELDHLGILAVGVKVMNRAIALSLLNRHTEAVELASQLVVHGVASEMPNATALIQMAFVYHRAGDTQRALDLIRRPPRLAVGRALDAWRFGRALLLAEILVDSNRDLAAHILGCVDPTPMVTLEFRRRVLLETLGDHHGPALDALLTEGAELGEDRVVDRAHEQLRAAGFTP